MDNFGVFPKHVGGSLRIPRKNIHPLHGKAVIVL